MKIGKVYIYFLVSTYNIVITTNFEMKYFSFHLS